MGVQTRIIIIRLLTPYAARECCADFEDDKHCAVVTTVPLCHLPIHVYSLRHSPSLCFKPRKPNLDITSAHVTVNITLFT